MYTPLPTKEPASPVVYVQLPQSEGCEKKACEYNGRPCRRRICCVILMLLVLGLLIFLSMAILAPSEDHEHHRRRHHEHHGENEDHENESTASDAEKLRDENDVIPLRDPKSRQRGGHKGKQHGDEDKPHDEVLEPAQRIRRPKIGSSTEQELVPLAPQEEEGKEEVINVGTSEVSSDTVDPIVKPDLISQPRRGGPSREHGEHGEHGEQGENEHGEHGKKSGDDDDNEHGKKEKGHQKHGGHKHD